MPEVDDDVLETRLARLGLEDKVALLTGRDSWSLMPLKSIGLRSIVMSDGPAGVRGVVWDERDPSCNFPSPTALAASWDRETIREVGRGLGAEARRKGVHVVLGPTINLHRTPYAGRHFEAFSEDPLLTAELASAYVQGIQELGVAATLKHYVANDSETDRFTVDVRVTERALRELYLLAFEIPVVEGGAWAVMSAYNSVNGVTASENALLADPLTQEWGFDGVVVSDWTAVRSIESARHPQDLAMPGPHSAWGDRLLSAVHAGEVDESVIDAKVLRVLRLAARVGALEDIDETTDRDVPSIDVRSLARSAAVEGTVLLTNDGVLPLGELQSIAVIGEGARFARTQGGGSATVVPEYVVSPLDGIRRRYPDARVRWERGAVVHEGVTDFEPGSYVTPDGVPGVLVRYLDDSGNVKGTEIRQSCNLVWFNGDSLGTTSSVVEFALTYTPDDASENFPLGIAGVSEYEVIADGTLIADGRLTTGPGDDPSAIVLNPPSTSIRVPVRGRQVNLVVRFRPATGGMPDALALRVGCTPPVVEPGVLISQAAALAAASDLAIVVVGTSSAVESEGFDRDSLRLPGSQDDLVRAITQANDRTIVVINAGAPVLTPWRDDAAAVLAVWFPGQESGHAIADVISGDAEPGGRLPTTWPVSEDDLPVGRPIPVDGRLEYDEGIDIGYRAWLRAGTVPAFAFGHGLGYTDWLLSDLTATPLDDRSDAQVSLLVRNVGERSGKCVVQLYLERVSASNVARPVRWLAAFETVRVDSHETRRLHIALPARRFAHWDGTDWSVEDGAYRLVAGLSASDSEPSTTIEVTHTPITQLDPGVTSHTL